MKTTPNGVLYMQTNYDEKKIQWRTGRWKQTLTVYCVYLLT